MKCSRFSGWRLFIASFLVIDTVVSHSQAWAAVSSGKNKLFLKGIIRKLCGHLLEKFQVSMHERRYRCDAVLLAPCRSPHLDDLSKGWSSERHSHTHSKIDTQDGQIHHARDQCA